MRATMLAVAMCFVVGGCVTTGAFDRKVAELDELRAGEAGAAAAREKALLARVGELEARRDALAGELEKKGAELAKAVAERDALHKQLDDSTALVGELKKRLEKLGQNVDKLSSEKGELAKGLDDARLRLDELRKQKAAADARAATFHNLIDRLRGMIDANQLKVVIRDGRMLIALPNDVLFDSGKTDLKPAGRAALAKVAQVLSAIADRHFVVAGHTDNVPIHSHAFPSNWELSTSRAVSVTNLLIESGMRPETLSAAGYGEFDPLAPNDTVEHRMQNRRIEIVLEPNLSDLPSLDKLAGTGP